MFKISVISFVGQGTHKEAYLSLKCLTCLHGRFKFVISLSLGVRIIAVKCQIGSTGLGRLIRAQAGLKGLFRAHRNMFVMHKISTSA